MSKIRLNEERRNDLLALAAKKLQDTPLPETVKTRLDAARKNYIAKYDAYTAEVAKALKAKWPLSELKKFNDLRMIVKATSVVFVTPDNEFREAAYPAVKTPRSDHHRYDGIGKHFYVSAKCNVLSGDVHSIMNGWDRAKHDAKLAKKLREVDAAESNYFILRPEYGHNEYDLKTGHVVSSKDDSSRINIHDKTGTLTKAQIAFQNALEEIEMAEGEVHKHTAKLRQSFEALISTARNLEDVAAVWSEAEELRDQFLASSNLPSVISEDAVRLIAENVAARSA